MNAGRYSYSLRLNLDNSIVVSHLIENLDLKWNKGEFRSPQNE